MLSESKTYFSFRYYATPSYDRLHRGLGLNAVGAKFDSVAAKWQGHIKLGRKSISEGNMLKGKRHDTASLTK